MWALYAEEDVLLCGHNLGAFEIVGDRIRRLTTDGVNGVWNFKKVEGNPNLIISGTYNGLCLFEKIGRNWHYKSRIRGFDESSRFIEWDAQGNLWVSHGYKGVYRLRFSKDYTTVVQVQAFEKDDFPQNVSDLVLSKINGSCVFSGKDGVYVLPAEGHSFTRDSSYNAYFRDKHFPNYLKEDKFKNIWYFHDYSVGVLRYLEDGTYKKIDYPFISLERKLVSGFEYVFVLDKENALFGVEDGFAHYSSKVVKNYQKPFKVHIRSFKALSDSVVYAMNHFEEGREEQKIVPQFAFKNNSFEISYSASFMEGSEILYATYLQGLDDGYSKWSGTRVRSFSNLYEGVYTFEVKALNSYGVEAEPMKFSFEVLPPWYRTIYAKVGYLFFIILIMLVLFVVVNRRVELSKKKEKEKQLERFKAKEEQFKNAALLSEKEMIKMRNERLKSEMVFKEKELANSTINLIQKNELLSEIKAELKRLGRVHDFRDVDKKVSALIRKIDKAITNENNWEVFEMHFGQVHEEFLKKLIRLHPDLTQREQKLSAFIKMGMSSKEIASLMNITTRAVENNRYKLRQKLGIEQGENLSAYIGKI
ncbi:helix-turn-helix and ligand-binding sensor domain-containing protein [Saccharicrinis fermentans]|uniref:Response regulator containing a CheY-like receiver domain and a GGDEF domain protein n=1 Tax=Saccharicrinis fermentans DSM 9555 = JCM 21142 TaxID=869213 RepID=W7Y7G0_9BACT|nr:triple tyrosine motif-containing protein [Saccharicrinis fermentans]GAF04192.1 response regulator containing a CheY-like receiver domain and a GGDEF domain protein [Saccharicrinis fermentans DSM 9555 = JCM 21142]